MDPFIMKVCFLGVGNPTNLELPLLIFTQDRSFSFIVSSIYYSFFFHNSKEKSVSLLV